MSKSSNGAPVVRDINFTSGPLLYRSRRTKAERRGLCHSVSNSDRVATETNNTGSGDVDRSISDDQLSAVHSGSSDSLAGNSLIKTTPPDQLGSQTLQASNGSGVSSDTKQDKLPFPELQSTQKRSRLTAREKLRAARVLGRNTETKASKSKLGSSVLDALKESERGKKRSGLPEAPTNMFDDSKRGMPKPGWTFQFPGGADLFFIVFSFVFISTVMFATTYVVWKLGAIHFNEN